MITVIITQDLDSWVNGLILRIRRKTYEQEGYEFTWGYLSEHMCQTSDVSVIQHGCLSWMYLWVTTTCIVDKTKGINEFSKGLCVR